MFIEFLHGEIECVSMSVPYYVDSVDDFFRLSVLESGDKQDYMVPFGGDSFEYFVEMYLCATTERIFDTLSVNCEYFHNSN